MSLGAVAFTHDIEKPQVKISYKNNRNSMKKSKAQVQLSIDSNEKDLRRRRNSSDFDELFSRKETQKEVRVQIVEPAPQPPTTSISKPSPPIVPMSKSTSSPRFRPRPPGAPKAPVANPRASNVAPSDIPIAAPIVAPIVVPVVVPEQQIQVNEANIENNIATITTQNEESSDYAVNECSAPAVNSISSLPHVVENRKMTYIIQKDVCSRIGKKKINLSFFKENLILYSVVVEGKPKSLQIKRSDSQIFTILICNNLTSFALRKGGPYGDEIISIQINKAKKPIHHKNVVLHTFANYPNYSSRIENLAPYFDVNGVMEPSFGDRKIIPSIKNMLFIDANHKELIAVMKVSKTTVCIEAVPGWTDEMFFTVALAAVIGKE